MRFSLRKKSRARCMPAYIIAGIIVASVMFWTIEHHLKPTLITMAEAKATVIATQIINDVIHQMVGRSLDSKKLLHVTLDNRGRVVLIQPNTMEFNKIAAETAIEVQKSLKNLNSEKIYIPIGQAFGSQLFASFGPKVVVTIIPIGTVEVNVIDKFEQAGINQTRHLVYLVATTQIKIVVPMVSKKISVDTRVPITEYVVVGDVPSTYVQIPSAHINDSLTNQYK